MRELVTELWKVVSALESPPGPRQEGAKEVHQVSHKLASGDHQHIDRDQGGAHISRC